MLRVASSAPVLATPRSFQDVHQENFGLFASRERYRSLPADTGAITGNEQRAPQRHLAGHEMKPGAAPRRQVVHQVVTTLDQGRVDECVLLQVE